MIARHADMNIAGKHANQKSDLQAKPVEPSQCSYYKFGGAVCAHRGSVAPPWPAVRPDAKRAPRPAATHSATSISVAAVVRAL